MLTLLYCAILIIMPWSFPLCFGGTSTGPDVFLSTLLLSGALATMIQVKPGEKIMRNRPGLSIKETFEIYVKSIQKSDLENLFSTITDNERFMFLTSNGELFDSRKAYYEFHEKWFERKDWEMPVELLECHEDADYGWATAIFHYRSGMPGGGRYLLDSYFTLIFHVENNVWKAVADLCTLIAHSFADKDAAVTYDEKQYYLFNVLKNRRTVRKFKLTPIPEDHVTRILDAACCAPTAGKQQPWKFLVIRDREKLESLKDAAVLWYLETCESTEQPEKAGLESARERVTAALKDVLSAPAYVAVLVDSNVAYPDYITREGTLAAGYLMIAARSLGYGTGFFTTYFPEERMREFFQIPEQYKLICFTPIGVPEKWPQMPEKKKLEDVIVYDSF